MFWGFFAYKKMQSPNRESRCPGRLTFISSISQCRTLIMGCAEDNAAHTLGHEDNSPDTTPWHFQMIFKMRPREKTYPPLTLSQCHFTYSVPAKFLQEEHRFIIILLTRKQAHTLTKITANKRQSCASNHVNLIPKPMFFCFLFFVFFAILSSVCPGIDSP